MSELVATVSPRLAACSPDELRRFWWHHARGLELTLAVNFWWANGGGALLALAADGWKRVRGLSR